VPRCRLRIALDVARGMTYLHAMSFLHRDLKSLNVLLDNDMRAKVCDLGLARTRAQTMTMGQGTIPWLAPECFTTGHYTDRCDVYAFGVVVWELVTGRVPYDDVNSFKLVEHILDGGRLPRPDNASPIGVRIMESCLAADPLRRPPFAEVVQWLEEASAAHEDLISRLPSPPADTANAADGPPTAHSSATTTARSRDSRDQG
jgi:Serine/threonine protein kinase